MVQVQWTEHMALCGSAQHGDDRPDSFFLAIHRGNDVDGAPSGYVACQQQAVTGRVSRSRAWMDRTPDMRLSRHPVVRRRWAGKDSVQAEPATCSGGAAAVRAECASAGRCGHHATAVAAAAAAAEYFARPFATDQCVACQ